MPTLLFTSKR